MVKEMFKEARVRNMSRTVNHRTPGIVAFSAPVFDYPGNIALTITIMGSTGTVDTDWDGPMPKALGACAQGGSKRRGYRVS
ncbi:hypothetical protein RM96_28365 [Cupriavidus sp. IDO]|nr:hypothetical protein RM96_28365 [Cupriavidus sp. IDO]